jgi:hypothetical protein
MAAPKHLLENPFGLEVISDWSREAKIGLAVGGVVVLGGAAALLIARASSREDGSKGEPPGFGGGKPPGVRPISPMEEFVFAPLPPQDDEEDEPKPERAPVKQAEVICAEPESAITFAPKWPNPWQVPASGGYLPVEIWLTGDGGGKLKETRVPGIDEGWRGFSRVEPGGTLTSDGQIQQLGDAGELIDGKWVLDELMPMPASVHRWGDALATERLTHGVHGYEFTRLYGWKIHRSYTRRHTGLGRHEDIVHWWLVAVWDPGLCRAVLLKLVV